jgi:cell division septation protein DedD
MATSGEHELGEEDRLPWLETVDEEESGNPSLLRILSLVVLGLAIIAAVIFGIHWFQSHHAGPTGNGDLIAAQEGDYKVKPDDPGGLNVKGEGDAAVATSDGAGGATGKIDPNSAPEAPVAGAHAAPAKPNTQPAGKTAVLAVPASGGTLSAGGAVVQLGSFPNAGAANDEWADVSKKFGFLAGLGKSVQQANVNGNTVFRLRVNAGSTDQARDICGKLKAAGQACFVTSG